MILTCSKQRCQHLGSASLCDKPLALGVLCICFVSLAITFFFFQSNIRKTHLRECSFGLFKFWVLRRESLGKSPLGVRYWKCLKWVPWYLWFSCVPQTWPGSSAEGLTHSAAGVQVEGACPPCGLALRKHRVVFTSV